MSGEDRRLSCMSALSVGLRRTGKVAEMALPTEYQRTGPSSIRPLILIVEDDPAVARMIQDYLTASGYRTARAGDGREAVMKVGELQPDLIVMDLMMPKLTGGEAARELRNDPLTEGIPIVGISAVADVSSIADLLPIDEVLPKPFDLDDLGSMIERLLPAFGNTGSDVTEQP
jgi:CheY-like chemotaxis protein